MAPTQVYVPRPLQVWRAVVNWLGFFLQIFLQIFRGTPSLPQLLSYIGLRHPLLPSSASSFRPLPVVELPLHDSSPEPPSAPLSSPLPVRVVEHSPFGGGVGGDDDGGDDRPLEKLTDWKLEAVYAFMEEILEWEDTFLALFCSENGDSLIQSRELFAKYLNSNLVKLRIEAKRIAVAGRGSENLRERLTMSKKTSKVEAARACKSTTESDCKERGACEKEDLYCISTRLCLQQWCNSDEKETLRSTMKVVLDLDETLVCAYETSSLPAHLRTQAIEAGLKWFELECVSSDKECEGKPNISYVTVFERPGLQEFLEQISEFAELVLFTAALEGYARPLVDKIDAGNRFSKRLYRPSTVSTFKESKEGTVASDSSNGKDSLKVLELFGVQ
uniref:Mitochondrial import inner membrane translocase subunit TIM50 n=1 Tax=Vitis vinifera TaxID=29760 RepID=A5B8A7_VITVI|nr:hypothetical protein VITISV_004711 [Vitis vinifera]